MHYLDLGHPEIGFNPLTIDATPGARAAVFLQALIEANPPGAIQAASDSFLRQAVAAVCAIEREPTLWHVYRMLDFGPSPYRDSVVAPSRRDRGQRLRACATGVASSPPCSRDRGYAAQALNPPRNKLERLISTREIDTLLRHPVALDLEGILQRGEVLIVAGAKATVGEDNTVLVTQLLLQLLHRALQAQHDLPRAASAAASSLLIDEAHNVLTPSVAKMLAEGRSAGLEAVFAWQYSAQIRDEVIRSGVRSLLQSLSIFRMREMEDARSLAGLAMEVYSDRISIDQEEQERLRFSPDDIVKLPIHRAINLWVADGVPRAGFLAHTLPMEDLHDDGARRASPRRAARARRPPPRAPPEPARRTQADNDDTPAPPRRASSSRSGTAKRRPGGQGCRQPRCSCRSTRPTLRTIPRPRAMVAPAATSTLTATTAQRSNTAAATPSCRAPSSRATSRSSATSGATSSSPPHSCSSCGGPTPSRGRASAACASSSTPAISSASARSPAAAPTPGPTTSAKPATSSCNAPGSSTRRRRYHPRAIYDYGHVLHELQLNAWVLAYRRAAGRLAAGLARRDSTSTPPAEARRGPPRLDDDWSVEDLRDPRARSLRPDALLELAGDDGDVRTVLVEYDRTRRVDKNFDKFRRYDAFLCWWSRHTPYGERDGAPVRRVRLPDPRPAPAVPRDR